MSKGLFFYQTQCSINIYWILHIGVIWSEHEILLWCGFVLQIVHLKRFQFHNGRWVKSHKIVRFPFRDFDPTNYLVPGSSHGDRHHDNHNNNTETDSNYGSSYHGDDTMTTTMAGVQPAANGHLSSGEDCRRNAVSTLYYFIFAETFFKTCLRLNVVYKAENYQWFNYCFSYIFSVCSVLKS